jgi:hypothetical protein
MDEQETLSSLKAHVACHQTLGLDDQRLAQLRADVSSIDLPNIFRLSAGVWASREPVGEPTRSLLNQLGQISKMALQRSLSWYMRSLRAAELDIQEQHNPYVELCRGLSPVVDAGCGRVSFLSY